MTRREDGPSEVLPYLKPVHHPFLSYPGRRTDPSGPRRHAPLLPRNRAHPRRERDKRERGKEKENTPLTIETTILCSFGSIVVGAAIYPEARGNRGGDGDPADNGDLSPRTQGRSG